MRYRIFEAGETDIGHGDAAAIGVGRSPLPQGVWGSAVRVAGLPASVSAQDVANFLEGAELRSGLESITFSEPASGTSRAALVELADEAAQQLALSRNNQYFGQSRLQVLPRTTSENAIASQTPAQQFSLRSLPGQQAAENIQQSAAFSVKQGLPGPVSSDGSTLKLRGLPYSATVADILQFFQGIGTLELAWNISSTYPVSCMPCLNACYLDKGYRLIVTCSLRQLLEAECILLAMLFSVCC